ncbi:MAG: YcjX family protein [Enterovibrio sp.]
MKSVTNQINKWVNRSLDRHICLAVTGLSRAGKTSFITSVINQLLHSATSSQLPLFKPAREGCLLGARRIQQNNLHIPAFDYDGAMQALHGQPPSWAAPTSDISEIRLEIRYRPQSKAIRLLQETATLYVDLIDYPGEWLLDLPLLSMSFEQWSSSQEAILKGSRNELAKPWLELLATLDLNAPFEARKVAAIAEKFTAYLHSCKDKAQLHWVQPGRFVLPGEYAGAPVLQFFPLVNLPVPSKVIKESNYAVLKQRYDYYCSHIVQGFYRDYFSKVDRQIVLVDVLQPLNSGPESFNDMRDAFSQLMQSFRYGKSSLLRRLFAPSIDKILFAATKADHITPDQQGPLVTLLGQLIHVARQSVAFEGIDISCQALASIQATQHGTITHQGEQIATVRGHLLSGGPALMYPGDVPTRLPGKEFWETKSFDFRAFRPMETPSELPLPHIGLDKSLQYLLADKFS